MKQKGHMPLMILGRVGVELGMKEPEMSRELARKGLKVFAKEGRAELLHQFQILTNPAAAVPEKTVSPHSACAMAMGTMKEADVLLTYA